MSSNSANAPEKVKELLAKFKEAEDVSFLDYYKEVDPEFKKKYENFEEKWLTKAKQSIDLLFNNLITMLEQPKDLSLRDVVNAIDVLLSKINIAEGKATHLIGIQRYLDVSSDEIDQRIKELDSQLQSIEIETEDIPELIDLNENSS